MRPSLSFLHRTHTDRSTLSLEYKLNAGSHRVYDDIPQDNRLLSQTTTTSPPSDRYDKPHLHDDGPTSLHPHAHQSRERPIRRRDGPVAQQTRLARAVCFSSKVYYNPSDLNTTDNNKTCLTTGPHPHPSLQPTTAVSPPDLRSVPSRNTSLSHFSRRQTPQEILTATAIPIRRRPKGRPLQKVPRGDHVAHFSKLLAQDMGGGRVGVGVSSSLGNSQFDTLFGILTS